MSAELEGTKRFVCRAVPGLLRECRRRLSENEPLDAAAKRTIVAVLNDAAELIDDLLTALETRVIADQEHRQKMASIMEELQEDDLIHDYLEPHCPECLAHAYADQDQCSECGLLFAEVDELEGEIARGRHRREKLRNAS